MRPRFLRPAFASRTAILWIALAALTPIAALVVWLTPLSFIPVPWPDDSAFYFVARELFRWPPRWVMLPQAPFEPTYRIFNFNTMPLYPILIGLGRTLGIDGSFGLKIWPLGAYAASGAWLTWRLGRAGLSLGALTAVTLAFALDPSLHWASVLLRPESLIGLFGMALVLELSLGEAESAPDGAPGAYKLDGAHWAHKLYDPIAALLAGAAYCHFNSVHLLFPVVAAYALRPRRLAGVAARAALYLSPWFLAVLWHFDIFVTQMRLQWSRLAVGNDWLSSPEKALHGIFQSMGSPVPWPEGAIHWAAGLLWVLVFAALAALVLGLARAARQAARGAPRAREPRPSLVPAAAWVIGAAWLWETKPEVWFTYYLHEALLTFAGLAALLARPRALRYAAAGIALALAALYGYADARILDEISEDPSWRWDTYHAFIDCIDGRLTDVRAGKAPGTPFSVWDPTFPDVTIELSRRHPDWELTRTNDFYTRNGLAIRHGKEVDAVVVPEIWGETGRRVQGLAEQYPEIQSIWMNWRDYYLAQLGLDRSWKPKRYICAESKWQAFIYVNER